MAADRKKKLTFGESRKAVRDSLVLQSKNLKKTLDAYEKEKRSNLTEMKCKEKKLRRSMQALNLERDKIAAHYQTTESVAQVETTLPQIGEKSTTQNNKTDPDNNSDIKRHLDEETVISVNKKKAGKREVVSIISEMENKGNETRPKKERKTGRMETEKAFLIHHELTPSPRQVSLSTNISELRSRSKSLSLLSEKEMQEVNKSDSQRKKSFTNTTQVGRAFRKISPSARLLALESRPRARSDIERVRRITSHESPRFLETREKISEKKISLAGSYSSPRNSRRFLYHSPQIERKTLSRHILDEEFDELKRCRYLRFTKEQEKEFEDYLSLNV